MDKSREEFELAIEEKYGNSIDYGVCKNGDGEYLAWDMQVAWWAWQASRKALVVEQWDFDTFSPYDCGDDAVWMTEVIKTLRQAGITVKGDE